MHSSWITLLKFCVSSMPWIKWAISFELRCILSYVTFIILSSSWLNKWLLFIFYKCFFTLFTFSSENCSSSTIFNYVCMFFEDCYEPLITSPFDIDFWLFDFFNRSAELFLVFWLISVKFVSVGKFPVSTLIIWWTFYYDFTFFKKGVFLLLLSLGLNFPIYVLFIFYFSIFFTDTNASLTPFRHEVSWEQFLQGDCFLFFLSYPSIFFSS